MQIMAGFVWFSLSCLVKLSVYKNKCIFIGLMRNAVYCILEMKYYHYFVNMMKVLHNIIYNVLYLYIGFIVLY